MTLLAKIIFLHKAKEELIDKLKNPETTYSEMTEIYQKMKQINLELRELHAQRERNNQAESHREKPDGKSRNL